MQAMELDRPPSSAARFWHTPELVRLILSHLARERVDLLAISRVNRALRTIVLPFLVRTLDLPLCRLDQYASFFYEHPELDHHVRYVRIIDDAVTTNFWYREDGQRGTGTRASELLSQLTCPDVSSSVSRFQWKELLNFIGSRWPLARFDITAGASSAEDIGKALKTSRMAQNVVAIRWIADHPEPANPNIDTENRLARYTECWSHVSEVVNGITLAQRTADIKLATLQINEHLFGHEDHLAILSALWEGLRKVESGPIQTLSININKCHYEVFDESMFFDSGWPQLKRLMLDFAWDEVDAWTVLESERISAMDIDSWISDHPQLQHLDIFSASRIPSLSLENEFSYLRSIALRGCDPEPVGAFLLRSGPQLIELELPRFIAGGGVRAAIRPGMVLPNLRVLRAPPRAVMAMIDGQHAPQLAHIEFNPVRTHGELMLVEWILPGSNASTQITCLDIDLQGEKVVDATHELGCTIFTMDRLPSLTELCLRSTYSIHIDGWFDSDRYLKGILADLQWMPPLRVLRIEEMDIQPFPDSGPAELETFEYPLKLDYLIWHSPRFNCTQYYRVIRQPLEEVANPYAEPPLTLLKFQRLPASFRANISDEGEWIQSSRLRHNNTIFDHTVSPPRLRHQPWMS
ncbi:hypothetical protein OC846_001788 [Tilletia horrida]|uniref:Uncharacterized protein n=1 Tax=Tilletia horrida TaxID=155126 RepID=A0AAN6GSC3_9BASI|nr:hypothetical protein OC845_001854 [Tilletia horrida]KAK0555275.1 hypothetical protein OC846_001788 [Tilletia horrida]